ncbi:uncharacterized protein LOC8286781 [Ricinus communis]|uniref:Uncharacterized protein n=1 Tax=Ricinus communis TaxID=3988 RepID=B9RMD0_RICCO|nr:uncharacterized protein LOC8286781 [Ricinus communis]EEF47453.1 conserved hypothetical protein [Ricinus communis]|eukprot:XP_002514899.1 uncharacterized protein LOC8286781 [Ricinus communis]
MESSQKLKLIDEAIKKLLAEKRNSKEVSGHSSQEDNDHHLLNRLLSELEVLKGGSTVEESEDEADSASVEKPDEEVGSSTEIGAEEIVKELKHVKRQNIVTHCLLSALIVITVAWQVSEVSLILKLKDGFTHPFKSFGSVLAGMIKLPGANTKDAEKDKEHTEASSPLHMPELPHIPDLGLHGDKK